MRRGLCHAILYSAAAGLGDELAHQRGPALPRFPFRGLRRRSPAEAISRAVGAATTGQHPLARVAALDCDGTALVPQLGFACAGPRERSSTGSRAGPRLIHAALAEPMGVDALGEAAEPPNRFPPDAVLQGRLGEAPHAYLSRPGASRRSGSGAGEARPTTVAAACGFAIKASRPLLPESLWRDPAAYRACAQTVPDRPGEAPVMMPPASGRRRRAEAEGCSDTRGAIWCARIPLAWQKLKSQRSSRRIAAAAGSDGELLRDRRRAAPSRPYRQPSDPRRRARGPANAHTAALGGAHEPPSRPAGSRPARSGDPGRLPRRAGESPDLRRPRPPRTQERTSTRRPRTEAYSA